MKHLFVVPLVLAAAMMLGGGDAEACSCEIDSRPKSESEIVEIVQKDRDVATAVFAGTVVLEETLSVTLEIERVWKGAPPKRVSIRSRSVDNGDRTITVYTCDASFKAGEKYLVFALGPLTDLRVTRCSLTGLLAQASDTVRRLDELAERERRSPPAPLPD